MPTTLRTALIAAAVFATAASAQAQEVTLRSSIQTAGAAVTLGDLFQDAGPVAGVN